MSEHDDDRACSKLLQVTANPVPLRFSSEGCAYVAQTRVPLETVVFHFNQGATPEEILQSFPSLHLADIYAVLAFYRNQREDVDSYIRDFRSRYAEVRERAREHTDAASICERLLARRKSSA